MELCTYLAVGTVGQPWSAFVNPGAPQTKYFMAEVNNIFAWLEDIWFGRQVGFKKFSAEHLKEELGREEEEK